MKTKIFHILAALCIILGVVFVFNGFSVISDSLSESVGRWGLSYDDGSVEHYLGGDAYNFICGASIKAGKNVSNAMSNMQTTISGLAKLIFGCTMMIIGALAENIAAKNK